MGHSTITVTMDRYGHLMPHLEEMITERMNEGYRQAYRTPLVPTESLDTEKAEANDLR